MNLTFLATPALLSLFGAMAVLVIFNNWRMNLVALAVQWASVAVLLSGFVLWRVVLVYGLVGAVVVTMLTLTGRALRFGEAAQVQSFVFSTSVPFRFIAWLMVMLATWSVASQPQLALPNLPGAANLASYSLMGLGLLNLGLTEEPINAGLGLLMVLSGFQLFYASVEPSLALVALLAAVNFGIALAVCYLAGLWYGPSVTAATVEGEEA